MRLILSTINIAVIIVLGYFAKDNLLAHVKNWQGIDTPPVSSPLPRVEAEKAITRLSPTIEIVFSPKSGATEAIVKAIAEARNTILVSAYSFTSKDIAEALLKAKKRNVTVRLILDKSQVTDKYSSSTFFVNTGFDIRIDDKHAIFHNKYMIVDDKTVITGSFNFTKAAEFRNAENVIIIRNDKDVAKRYTKNWLMHHEESVTPQDYKLKQTQKSKQPNKKRNF